MLCLLCVLYVFPQCVHMHRMQPLRFVGYIAL